MDVNAHQIPPTALIPTATITGESIVLGPAQRDIIPLLGKWRGDFAVQRTFGGMPRPVTLEQATANYERMMTGDDVIGFSIYERATSRPIGFTDLFEIDWRARTAIFGILIGEADARGRGYGTETAQLMLDYAFTALGFHSVMLSVDAFNLAGQAAYRKAGFKEFGRRRQSSFLNGVMHDIVYMDCLASEFTSPVLAAVFVPDVPRQP